MKARNIQRMPLLIMALFGAFVLGAEKVIKPLLPPLYLNLSSSAPKGIYYLNDTYQKVTVGDVVLFTLPRRTKSILSQYTWFNDAPFLKSVGALSGQKYCIEKKRFIINQKPIGKVYSRDLTGKELPSQKGCHTVRPDHFLPVSVNEGRVIDGRYLGDIPVSFILGRIQKVLVW